MFHKVWQLKAISYISIHQVPGTQLKVPHCKQTIDCRGTIQQPKPKAANPLKTLGKQPGVFTIKYLKNKICKGYGYAQMYHFPANDYQWTYNRKHKLVLKTDQSGMISCW